MSGDELTDNEPTVRYWRDPSEPSRVLGLYTPDYFPSEGSPWVPVHVLTEAELEAHTTAARADGYDEGYSSGASDAFSNGGHQRAANPYRSTESED